MRCRKLASFEFVKTEQDAKKFCDMKNKLATYYMRKNHPAHYTQWQSEKPSEYHFVCWYY